MLVDALHPLASIDPLLRGVFPRLFLGGVSLPFVLLQIFQRFFLLALPLLTVSVETAAILTASLGLQLSWNLLRLQQSI